MSVTVSFGTMPLNTAVVGDAVPQSAQDPWPPAQFNPSGQSNPMIGGGSAALGLCDNNPLINFWDVWQCGNSTSQNSTGIGPIFNSNNSMVPSTSTFGGEPGHNYEQWVAYFGQYSSDGMEYNNAYGPYLPYAMISFMDDVGNLVPFNFNLDNYNDATYWSILGSPSGSTVYNGDWTSDQYNLKSLLIMGNSGSYMGNSLFYVKVISTGPKINKMVLVSYGNVCLQLLQATPRADDVFPTTSSACVAAPAVCTIKQVGYQLCPDPSGSQYNLLVPTNVTCESLTMPPSAASRYRTLRK
jgi:hypothetical protein